jgi:hypothetical protein
MAHVLRSACAETELESLERVNYFPRQLLTVDDMETERDYFLQKLRRHNRFLHGFGVVCGLAVTPSPTEELPWRVQVAEGYALDPQGNEIYVSDPVFVDLARCGPGASTDPCEPGRLRNPRQGTGTRIFLAIAYDECFAKPVRAVTAGCSCEQDCEYSRIRDSFRIECLTELPDSHQPPPGPKLCDIISGKLLPECPPCPLEPWVVLAEVTLPDSPAVPIEESSMDNFTQRRSVFSTAVIQQQLIECCCKQEPVPGRPVRVTKIEPPDGSQFTVNEFGGSNAPANVVVTFDKRLQPNTVSSNITVTRTAVTGQSVNFPGAVTYNDAAQTAVFTPIAPFTGEVNGAVYTITVRGSGPTPIRDLDNLALDGNGDGNGGDDFTSRFTVFFVVG